VNFRQLDDCLLSAVFFEISEVAQKCGLLSSLKVHNSYAFTYFDKRWIELHIGRFCSKNHLGTLPTTLNSRAIHLQYCFAGTFLQERVWGHLPKDGQCLIIFLLPTAEKS
jgi:hypothetical protein